MEGLISIAPDTPWSEAPEGMTIGHLHLQVGGISSAEAFYRDVLGLEVTTRYPGATFYGAGGYHHRIATNVWNSRGAKSVDERTLGLASFALSLADPDEIDAIRHRADTAGSAVEFMPSGIALTDPWGLRISVTA